MERRAWVCGGAVLAIACGAASGQTSHWTRFGTSSDGFGACITGVDDLDGDGVRDVLVGAPYRNNYSGRVFVFSGATGTTLRDIPYPSAGVAYFGTSAVQIDDRNGDGKRDFAIGAPAEGTSGYGSGSYVWGAVYEIDSVNSTVLAGNTGYADERWGTTLLAADDLDGDGFRDILTGTNAWTVYALNHAWLGVIWAAYGSDATFTFNLAELGDVDGDGVGDVAISDGNTTTVMVRLL